ncbi:hypothetical protein N7448_002217 [Penicillium atrosanguineum]|nr:hypothetical protein N7448_002217 [Penicillium atrosanguineum]
MPPKRQSTDASGSAAKNSKTGDPPRNPRWSKVSGSANADDGYRIKTSSLEAYEYICLCKPLHHTGLGDDDEEDEEGEEGNADKPSAAHPEHPWAVTMAGTQKLTALRIMSSLRDPDGFGMHTYNDHFDYGVLEVAQNPVLDFEEAKTWKEKWSICEGAALFFAKGDANPLFQVDDGEGAKTFMDVTGVMFAIMLAMLDREGLLKPDSEVKSLGVVMAGFVRFIAHTIGPDFGIRANDLDKTVLAYAKKYNIELKGLFGIEKELETAEAEAEKLELPASDDKNGDPWNWKTTLAQYQKDYGPKIGGDKLDITTWTPAERRKAAFDKKDPFSRKMIDAIKDGMIMQPA